jgi:phospholipid-binding lipoprotein MlaA
MRRAAFTALIPVAGLLALTACSRTPPAQVAQTPPAPVAPPSTPELAGGPPPSETPAVSEPAQASPAAVADAAPDQPGPAALTEPAAADRPASSQVSDPLQPINRQLFKADRAVSGLVEKTHVTRAASLAPAPARNGVANVIQNLDEPTAVANNLLQRSPRRALRAAARFLVNSTVGVAGLFDVASRLGLKRADANFSQTLASYGVKPGPYLYLPVRGPSSVRDVVGAFVDGYFWPVSWLKLGMLKQQAVNVARAGLERPPPRPVAPPPSQLATAKPADDYVAVRTAYQQTLPAGPPARPVPVPVPASRPAPAAPMTTIVASNP